MTNNQTKQNKNKGDEKFKLFVVNEKLEMAFLESDTVDNIFHAVFL
jgi:hypothetical protein